VYVIALLGLVQPDITRTHTAFGHKSERRVCVGLDINCVGCSEQEAEWNETIQDLSWVCMSAILQSSFFGCQIVVERWQTVVLCRWMSGNVSSAVQTRGAVELCCLFAEVKAHWHQTAHGHLKAIREIDAVCDGNVVIESEIVRLNRVIEHADIIGLNEPSWKVSHGPGIALGIRHLVEW